MRRHDRQEICKYFQNFSETYIEDVHDYSSGTKYLSKIELEFVLKNCLIKKKARVLEIGIGTGRIANVLSGKGATVDGIDVSKKMLEKAEKNLKGKCVSLKVADAGERLPYPNDTFDYVICIRVLKYIQRWKNAIKETFRVLNKNRISYLTSLICILLHILDQETPTTAFLNLQKLWKH